jgi:hypothetical protein
MDPVDIMNFIVKTFDALAWPLVTLLLVLLFRVNIASLIDRIRSVKHKDTVFEFGEENLDTEAIKTDLKPLTEIKITADLTSSPKIPIEKPATLFWLGNDLMWIQDMLYRNAPSWSIVEGLKNLQKYTRALGFKGSLADTELTRLLRDTQATLDSGLSNWSPEFKLSLARQIEPIKWFISARAEEQEPGFKKYRIFPSSKKMGKA